VKKAVFGLLGLVIIGLAAYAAVNVTGAWEYTMTTQRGEMKAALNFVQDGEKLAVTMVSERGGQSMESKGEGTVKGNDIEWKIVRQGRDGQEMTMLYKGKIADDNNMSGTLEGGMGGGTPREWKAVRKPK
jgi:hypothetical protein